jgi:hypothetical protein
MLEMDIAESHLDLHLTGVAAVLARRRCVRLPRERIHKAFVLGRSFAMSASPRLPCLGWSTRRHRVGVFGIGDTAQLWAAGARPVVLALYLRGEPYHRIVCEVADPVLQAAAINRWLRHGVTTPGTPMRQPAACEPLTPRPATHQPAPGQEAPARSTAATR